VLQDCRPANSLSLTTAFFKRTMSDRRNLGNMSGIELQRRLKDSGSRMPVIFIAAFESSDLKAHAERAGIACLRQLC
jgi:DNA-binding NarL/FixJ family response regulator